MVLCSIVVMQNYYRLSSSLSDTMGFSLSLLRKADLFFSASVDNVLPASVGMKFTTPFVSFSTVGGIRFACRKDESQMKNI
jgi:hypothetical protein